MIKHIVTCKSCGKETEAQYSGNRTYDAPYGWLTVSYVRWTSKGLTDRVEDHHACPDCAEGVLKALDEAF
jgi:ribosomal protein L37AE/L43A